MTIAARRRLYWGLFILACTCLAAFVPLYVSLVRLPAQPAFLVESKAFGRIKLFGASIPSPRLAGAGIGLGALFSAATLGLILVSFKKTVSNEVYFFAFWVLSVGMEVLRLVVYNLASTDGSPHWQAIAMRVLLFSRYSGYFALLAASLYAAGFRNEKIGGAAAFVLALAAALAASMPINTGTYAYSLELRAGYADLHVALYLIASIVAVVDFLYAASSSGEPSYRLVATGCLLGLVGRQLLVTQWNPFVLVAGFALIVTGSWLCISRLHTYYLWQ